MSRRTYRQALDEVLAPEGFSREGPDDWVRQRGDMQERVNLQRSWIDRAVTVNLYQLDLERERILKSIPSKEGLYSALSPTRIGGLIDGHDRWWKNDPNGPDELSQAVKVFGLPYFDRVKSLEDQLLHWHGGGAGSKWSTSNIFLAVLFYRMGRLDEAREVISRPIPKTGNLAWVDRVHDVRRWLGCE